MEREGGEEREREREREEGERQRQRNRQTDRTRDRVTVRGRGRGKERQRLAESERQRDGQRNKTRHRQERRKGVGGGGGRRTERDVRERGGREEGERWVQKKDRNGYLREMQSVLCVPYRCVVCHAVSLFARCSAQEMSPCKVVW